LGAGWLKKLASLVFKRGGPVSKTWAQKGRPRWKQLTPATRKQKKRLGYSTAADNTRTGALKRASLAPGYIFQTDRISVFRIPPEQNKYAGYINNGTSKMVDRPFYTLTAGDVQRIADALALKILEDNGL